MILVILYRKNFTLVDNLRLMILRNRILNWSYFILKTTNYNEINFLTIVKNISLILKYKVLY